MFEFDTSKKFMHLEDNEDGTLTITINLNEEFGGDANGAMVVEGTLMETLMSWGSQLTPEQFAEFQSHATLIPDEVPSE